MPAYDLAMLDFDGTLADSATSIVHCLRRTFIERGEEPPAESAIRATIGISLPMAMVHLRGRGRETNGDEWAAHYREIFAREGLEMLRLYEGAAELLGGLADLGVRAAIVSARKAEVTREILKANSLQDKVQAVYGDTPEGPNKPDPRLYHELILPRFNGSGSLRSIMIGDTHIDLEFARACGAASCWVRHGYGDLGRCGAMSPDYQADNLAQVLELF